MRRNTRHPPRGRRRARRVVRWPPRRRNRTPAAPPPRDPPTADPGAKKVLGLADIGRWNRIGNAALSADGKWMTYVYTPNEGDGTLYVRQLDGGKTYTIPVGSAPVFSDDSRYVGYFVSPPSAGAAVAADAAAAAGEDRPVRAAPAGGAAASVRAARSRRRATSTPVPDAATFKFSKGSKFLAVRANKANAAAKHNGADLAAARADERHRARTSATSISTTSTTPAECSPTPSTPPIATGNGVYVIDLATSQSKVLSSASLDYDQLTWGDKGASLAVLRGDKKKENLQRDNALLVWQDVSGAKPRAVEYDPSKDATFPKGYVLSEFTRAALDARRLARLRRASRIRRPTRRRRRRAPSRRPTSTSGTGRTPKCSRCRSFVWRRSVARRCRRCSTSRAESSSASPTR